jgi:hypothetical protein
MLAGPVLRCDEVDVPPHCCSECCWGGVHLLCSVLLSNKHLPQKFRQFISRSVAQLYFRVVTGQCPSKNAFPHPPSGAILYTECRIQRRSSNLGIPTYGESALFQEFPDAHSMLSLLFLLILPPQNTNGIFCYDNDQLLGRNLGRTLFCRPCHVCTMYIIQTSTTASYQCRGETW